MPPRPKATPDEILVTTIRLIAELDVSGVSVDMVAERSGVSKATIYRRWPSREALIFEALTYIDYPENSPDTGSVRSDFEVLLRGLVDFLNRDDGGNVYAAFLNAAMRDKNLAQLRGEVARKARLDYERVIERATARGELRPDANVSLLIDILIAPFVYRKISENAGAEPSDITGIIDIALAAFGSGWPEAREGRAS